MDSLESLRISPQLRLAQCCMTKNNRYAQISGIVIASIIACVAAIPATIDLIGLFDWQGFPEGWQQYVTELSYFVFVILFIQLCVIPWLKNNKLSTWWMLRSMLVTAFVIYCLLAFTCKLEPTFLRHEGMDLYAPWWLGGHRQFFVGLTAETALPYYKISILENGVFQSTLTDYPGLLVWAGCCLVGRYFKK